MRHITRVVEALVEELWETFVETKEIRHHVDNHNDKLI